MIFGNPQAVELLVWYFSRLEQTGKAPYNFLLLSWSSHIWKTTLALGLTKKLLGEFSNNDLLYIKDLSEYLGKEHSIKVDVSDKDSVVDIPDKGKFVDMWARQIIQWLNKSPSGKIKVLLLENIERMTLAAANSFLKTFEELEDNVIIIATTQNPSSLLPTILSRAFMIRFQTPSTQELSDYIKISFPEVSDTQREIICSISLNRIGFAIDMINWLKDDPLKNDMLTTFQRFVHICEDKKSLLEQYHILQQANKSWFWMILLDALLLYFSLYHKFDYVKKILATKKYIQDGVSYDNAVFWMGLMI